MKLIASTVEIYKYGILIPSIHVHDENFSHEMFIMPNGGCFIDANYKHTENYKQIELEIDDERYNAIMNHFKNWNK